LPPACDVQLVPLFGVEGADMSMGSGAGVVWFIGPGGVRIAACVRHEVSALGCRGGCGRGSILGSGGGAAFRA